MPNQSLLKQRFLIQKAIGSGLYGDIYACHNVRQENSSNTVAIKRICIQAAHDALDTKQLSEDPWQEVEVIEALMQGPKFHENILQYHEKFLDKEALYIVMELSTEGDLLTHLEKSTIGYIEEHGALRIFEQLASGLKFLHEEIGIAHRDISLENVLLVDGVCKINDFGMSVSADYVCCDVVGKAFYMAPEVVAGTMYDPVVADMWSLGIVLFILVTGYPLVQIASSMDEAFRAFRVLGVRGVLNSWQVESRVSNNTVNILEGLLQVDPSKRMTLDEVTDNLIIYNNQCS